MNPLGRILSFILAFSFTLSSFSLQAVMMDESFATSHQENDTSKVPDFLADADFGSIYKKGSDILVFMWKRVPNLEETMIDITTQAPLDVALGGFTASMTSPSSKSFLRDMTKIPGAMAKAEAGARVGGTEFIFDESNVWSQTSKSIVKVGSIGFLVTFIKMDKDTAASYGNYLGEYAARFFINAGQDRQIANETIPFQNYLVEHFDPTWFFDTVVEATPKVLVSNMLSNLIKGAGIGPFIKDKIISTSSMVLPSLQQGGALEKNSYAWKTFLKVYKPDNSYIRTSSLFATTFAVFIAASFAEQFVTTYLLAPACRIVTDSVALFNDQYTYPLWEQYTSPAPQATTGKDEL
jgi:hypothetical protein